MASQVQAILKQRGLALPATPFRGGYFALRDRYELAWSALANAVFTAKGSRPMARTFGSRLHELLFEPDAAQQLPMIEQHVRDTAQRSCPMVVVDGVSLKAAGQNMIGVQISFHLRGETGTFTRLVELPKLKGV